jgi:hypothetical protein
MIRGQQDANYQLPSSHKGAAANAPVCMPLAVPQDQQQAARQLIE